MRITEVKSYATLSRRVSGSKPEGVPIADDYFIPNHLLVPDRIGTIYPTGHESVLVKITAEDGTVGWGEALNPASAVTTKSLIDTLFGPFLLGKSPLEVAVLWNAMFDMMRVRGYGGGFYLDAIAACDIALWDLKGKHLDTPVHALLGGSFRGTIPAYVSGLRGTTDADKIRYWKEWIEKGFEEFKLSPRRAADVEMRFIEELMDETGDSTRALMFDPHWQYGWAENVRIGRFLERFPTRFFEAPLPPEDLDGHARLADKVAVPIAVGECLRNRFEFRDWIGHGAVQVIQPDIGRMGITEFCRIAAYAEVHNIPVAPHISIHLGIAIAATLQAAAATPNLLTCEFQPGGLERANSILSEPLRYGEGCYLMPGAPGLGVDVVEEEIQKNAV